MGIYFIPHLPEYNRCFREKYFRVNSFNCSPRWINTALFTDGHKVQINRDPKIFVSGHKWMYCLSYLITCAMNGFIVEAYGAAVGSDNDYRLQNDSQLRARLSALQVFAANRIVFSCVLCDDERSYYFRWQWYQRIL